jgi:hypothetical protein
MEKLSGGSFIKIMIVLFILTGCMTGAKAQDEDWLNGTWIGLGYQINTKSTWQIKLDASVGSNLFEIEYPSLQCKGKWKLIDLSYHKAIFMEEITSGQCVTSSSVVITRINEQHITYSCFSSQNNVLSAYATLIKVDNEEVAQVKEVMIENHACDNLYVDLERGTLNGLSVGAAQKDIKTALPCFTGDTPDGSEFNCGGGVFFIDHDFYFYSGQDYIEIRKNFKGTVSVDILNKSPEQVTKILGMPDYHETVRKWDETVRTHYFYKRKYGCFSIVFIKGKSLKVAIHNTPINETGLCY